MRNAFLTAVVGISLSLLYPAVAAAHEVTASGGGIKATLSYSGGPGITTKNVRLSIAKGGKTVYNQPVPATGCTKVCGPGGKQPLTIASLYGDDGQDVVLNLWSGGADCCTLADVYVPSAAMGSYVLDQHNFGEGGYTLENIGPKQRPEFVSSDTRFYCAFGSSCADSALPLQIFQFSAEKFVNVTKQYPKLIAADAARWYTAYFKNPKQGLVAIVAWAADEYNLGDKAQALTVLKRQVAHGYVKASIVSGLQRFLPDNGY
jgi:hypothetical protein